MDKNKKLEICAAAAHNVNRASDAKEHPCFVAYDDLPPEQKEKDHLFVSTVLDMALIVGLEG